LKVGDETKQSHPRIYMKPESRPTPGFVASTFLFNSTRVDFSTWIFLSLFLFVPHTRKIPETTLVSIRHLIRGGGTNPTTPLNKQTPVERRPCCLLANKNFARYLTARRLARLNANFDASNRRRQL
jgi:hypothetical protein